MNHCVKSFLPISVVMSHFQLILFKLQCSVVAHYSFLSKGLQCAVSSDVTSLHCCPFWVFSFLLEDGRWEVIIKVLRTTETLLHRPHRDKMGYCELSESFKFNDDAHFKGRITLLAKRRKSSIHLSKNIVLMFHLKKELQYKTLIRTAALILKLFAKFWFEFTK